MSLRQGIVIPKVWRSEINLLVAFIVSLFLSVTLSQKFPKSVIHGELVPWGTETLYLSLPLFWLIPAYFLSLALYRIYDVRYTATSTGIEERRGVISISQQIRRIRYEDIRSIEIKQTLLARFLNIGNLEIGTAATSAVEVILEGIAAPHEVQEMILKERGNVDISNLDKGQVKDVQKTSNA